MIVIKSFSGKYAFLSNFAPSPITMAYLNGHDEFEFPTVEHYFQASKASTVAERDAIRLAETPGQAKKLGRKCSLIDGWDAIKLHIMRQALAVKFDVGTPLAEELLATGDAMLIEGNTWGDRFWGVDGHGENWLGWLLMAQRAFLRSL